MKRDNIARNMPQLLHGLDIDQEIVNDEIYITMGCDCDVKFCIYN